MTLPKLSQAGAQHPVQAVIVTAMYYRYLAVDRGGPYPILSLQPLEPPRDGSISLQLLEVSGDYHEARRAHLAFAAFLEAQGLGEQEA